jgi:hypothetical protein
LTASARIPRHGQAQGPQELPVLQAFTTTPELKQSSDRKSEVFTALFLCIHAVQRQGISHDAETLICAEWMAKNRSSVLTMASRQDWL